MLEMKTTSNGRRPQNIKSWISQQPLIGSSSNFKLKLRGPNQNQKYMKWRRPPMEDDLQWKTTSNGRRPPNIKSWISQQPLIGSSSNFKLKLRGPNQNKKYLKWRRPPMEDNLKILKVEYLSNHWSDLPQILNLVLRDQTNIKKCMKWRWPPEEDNLIILKVEYLSNHWLDFPQILNLNKGDQTKTTYFLKWRRPQKKTTSKN